MLKRKWNIWLFAKFERLTKIYYFLQKGNYKSKSKIERERIEKKMQHNEREWVDKIKRESNIRKRKRKSLKNKEIEVQ